MAKKKSIHNTGGIVEELVRIVKILRSDKGCPWDRKQKITDVKDYLLEEVYELCEAIDSKGKEPIKEEIGDVFLLLVFLCVLFEEKGSFNINRPLETIVNKLIFRHPHVFSDANDKTAEAVLEKWIKNKSKRKKRRTVFERIPANTPALFSLFLYLKEARALRGFTLDESKKELESVFERSKAKGFKGDLVNVIFCSACLLSAQNKNPELLLKKKVKEVSSNVLYESRKGKNKR